MAVGRRSKAVPAGSNPFTRMKPKRFFKGTLVLGILVQLCCTGVVGQGIYAVTRRTRIHPALGTFLPPGATVVVAPLPMPNSFPQSAGNSFAVRGGNAVTTPQSGEAQSEVARKTLEFQIQRSRQGSAYAQYDLGLRYLSGDGVTMDRVEALRLLGDSAKQGNAQAAKKLAELRVSN